MGWVKPSEVNVGDTVSNYNGDRCIRITAIEPDVPNPNCGTAYVFHGQSYTSMAAVVPEQVTFGWPSDKLVFRMYEEK